MGDGLQPNSHLIPRLTLGLQPAARARLPQIHPHPNLARSGGRSTPASPDNIDTRLRLFGTDDGFLLIWKALQLRSQAEAPQPSPHNSQLRCIAAARAGALSRAARLIDPPEPLPPPDVVDQQLDVLHPPRCSAWPDGLGWPNGAHIDDLASQPPRAERISKAIKSWPHRPTPPFTCSKQTRPAQLRWRRHSTRPLQSGCVEQPLQTSLRHT